MNVARVRASRLVIGLLASLPARALADPGIADIQARITADGGQVTRHDRAAGDPYLDVLTAGLAWRVYFNECGQARPAACQFMSLRIGFAHASRRSLDSVNRWNQTHLFSRAFLDGDGSPTLAQDIALGGTEASAIAAYLQRWQTDIERFHDFVERDAAP